jgi:outer membrane protein assembly factor BamB
MGVALAGCGIWSSSGAHMLRAATTGGAAAEVAERPAAAPTSRNWTRFGYNAARTNAAPNGLGAKRIAGLVRTRVQLQGTVDSSPVYVSAARVLGHRRNLLVMTTTYGRTLGLDEATGAKLWSFTPVSYGSVAGSAQITTATPVVDPDRGILYAASPDGRIHKLRVRNGHEVQSGSWPAAVTKKPAREKIASALNLSGRHVLVTTGGYIGDAPPYQGKVVAIDRSSGRVVHVVNALCSDRRTIIDPSSCSAQRAAIWGRAGAVVDPATKNVYATTGNGPFNGATNWGDTVLQLAPGVASLKRHYTPTNQDQLNVTDQDLGSTSPALLPAPNGGPGARHLLQGGKDGKLRLMKIPSGLHGVTASAGRRLGGETQILPTPGRVEMFTAPAVLHRGGSTRVFAATGGGTAAYALKDGQLHTIWHRGAPGTSPVVAGRMLWVYDPSGSLRVYRAASGRLVRRFPAPPGHWNSPIVTGSRVYLPSGDANEHATSGTLSIYHSR